jgi:hypothetical protein
MTAVDIRLGMMKIAAQYELMAHQAESLERNQKPR